MTVVNAFAQSGTSWLENTMFASGKINVVIAVICTVFVLIVVYMISIDRKLKKVEEREQKESE
jgi:Tfp pilus assembly protein PilO